MYLFTHCLMQDMYAFNLQLQMQKYFFYILILKRLVLIFKIIKKKKKDKSEIKTASGWQHLTVKRVTHNSSYNLYDKLISLLLSYVHLHFCCL